MTNSGLWYLCQVAGGIKDDQNPKVIQVFFVFIYESLLTIVVLPLCSLSSSHKENKEHLEAFLVFSPLRFECLLACFYRILNECLHFRLLL